MAGHQDLIASVPLFAKLPPKSLDRIDRIMVEREFPDGAEIVREGEPGAGFFIIEDGTVEVLRGDGPTHVASLSRGAYFGDMALLDGRPRSATVRATGTVRCLAMTRWDFLAEVRSDPDIAVELLEELSLRIRELERRLSDAERVNA